MEKVWINESKWKSAVFSEIVKLVAKLTIDNGFKFVTQYGSLKIVKYIFPLNKISGLSHVSGENSHYESLPS